MKSVWLFWLLELAVVGGRSSGDGFADQESRGYPPIFSLKII